MTKLCHQNGTLTFAKPVSSRGLFESVIRGKKVTPRDAALLRSPEIALDFSIFAFPFPLEKPKNIVKQES